MGHGLQLGRVLEARAYELEQSGRRRRAHRRLERALLLLGLGFGFGFGFAFGFGFGFGFGLG